MESRQFVLFLKLIPSSMGRQTLPNLLIPLRNNHRRPSLLTNGHHRQLSTKSHSKPAPLAKEDDTAYFKRLGKTTNHYWTDNADQVLQRLNMEQLVDPDHDIALRENLRRRYCDDKIDLDEIRTLWGKWMSPKISLEERTSLAKRLVGMALWVPNETHPAALGVDGDVPVAIKVHGQPKPQHNVVEFQKVYSLVSIMCYI